MDIWTLNLRHLHAVERIARLGTVNAAASAVNLSQPAITQALGGWRTRWACHCSSVAMTA
ncbi:LysR family transcriptional regulator [Novosphingobium resinovorum]